MTTTTHRNRLPSLASIPVQEAPCHKCSALCCRYFALQIDTPEDAEDFDSIKWYLIHEDTWVWVDDDEWYVQVDRKCKHLQSNNLCGIYETRPQICRDYAIPEKLESPDEPLCDYFSKEIDHDHEFRTMDELEAYAAVHLSKREAKRRARSEAAKKAWAKKKMVQGTAKRRAG